MARSSPPPMPPPASRPPTRSGSRSRPGRRPRSWRRSVCATTGTNCGSTARCSASAPRFSTTQERPLPLGLLRPVRASPSRPGREHQLRPGGLSPVRAVARGTGAPRDGHAAAPRTPTAGARSRCTRAASLELIRAAKDPGPAARRGGLGEVPAHLWRRAGAPARPAGGRDRHSRRVGRCAAAATRGRADRGGPGDRAPRRVIRVRRRHAPDRHRHHPVGDRERAGELGRGRRRPPRCSRTG